MREPYDDTILTKWGRIPAREWLLRRFKEGLCERFDDQCLVYLEENWPTPEQVRLNCERRDQRRREQQAEQRATKRRTLRTQAIADTARVDGYSWANARRPDPASSIPANQLNIL